jgi:hypothetical protein
MEFICAPTELAGNSGSGVNKITKVIHSNIIFFTTTKNGAFLSLLVRLLQCCKQHAATAQRGESAGNILHVVIITLWNDPNMTC